jgi:hypothetical protein
MVGGFPGFALTSRAAILDVRNRLQLSSTVRDLAVVAHTGAISGNNMKGVPRCLCVIGSTITRF